MTWKAVEEVELPHLPRSPLKLALVQARTPPVLAFEQPDQVERLVTRLAGWRLTDRQRAAEVAFQLGPLGVRQGSNAPETVWVLGEQNGAFSASVSSSSVSIECNRYSAWPEFRAAIEELLGAVAELFAPSECTRFGMRYVNELQDERARGVPADLGELLNEALIAPALAFERPLRSSLSELRLGLDNGDFTIRHGLVAEGTYLLDFDAYDDHSQRFTVDALLARADHFHDQIEAAFAWSLTPAYLEALQAPIEAGDDEKPGETGE